MKGETMGIFQACAELAEAAATEIRSIGIDRSNRRQVVSLTLLTASVDQGRGLGRLLADDPVRYGAPAMALFRPQLEQFLRGALFSDQTYSTDVELEAFEKKEEMPSRTVEGQSVRIPMWMLAEHAAAIIARGVDIAPEMLAKLPGMVRLSSREIHGLVHGGTVVFHLYQIKDGALQFLWDLQGVKDFCVNSCLMCIFALIVAQKAAGVPGSALVSKDYGDAFVRFLDVVKDGGATQE